MTTTDDRSDRPSTSPAAAPRAGDAPTVHVVPWDDPAAAALRTAQQAELRSRYGDDDAGHEMTGDDVTAMVLLHVDGQAAACGAIRDVASEHGRGVGEVKRMYVLPQHRGRGHARVVLDELERLARELGWRRLILETGVLQPEAIGLYLRAGYQSIENFGEYTGVEESRCFTKNLRAPARERSERPAGVVTVEHVTWDDPMARELRRAMWDDNLSRYPEIFHAPEHAGGSEVDDQRQGVGILAVVVARLDGQPVGCATLREGRGDYPAGSAEVKKVYVAPSARGAGVARALLAALEEDARRLGLTRLVLQTGIRQPEAVGLYGSIGYRPVVPFGGYGPDLYSLYFGKSLTPQPARSLDRTLAITTVPWDDADAKSLRRAMFDDLALLYPVMTATLGDPDEFDALTCADLDAMYVAHADGEPVGCTGLRASVDGEPPGTGEVCRVFVHRKWRGTGIARSLLAYAEQDAATRGLNRLMLMTGVRQADAVRLYERTGYSRVPPFGPNAHDPEAVGFAKQLVVQA